MTLSRTGRNRLPASSVGAALAAGLPAGLRRFLRTTPAGKLRVDRAAVAAEERLDGKFLLRTSDPSLSAEDVALGYKQLLEVERELQRLHLGTFAGPAGTVRQRTETTHTQRAILGALDIDEPPSSSTSPPAPRHYTSPHRPAQTCWSTPIFST